MLASAEQRDDWSKDDYEVITHPTKWDLENETYYDRANDGRIDVRIRQGGETPSDRTYVFIFTPEGRFSRVVL